MQVSEEQNGWTGKKEILKLIWKQLICSCCSLGLLIKSHILSIFITALCAITCPQITVCSNQHLFFNGYTQELFWQIMDTTSPLVGWVAG
jgi:hypothetical protein